MDTRENAQDEDVLSVAKKCPLGQNGSASEPQCGRVKGEEPHQMEDFSAHGGSILIPFQATRGMLAVKRRVSIPASRIN